MTSLTVTAIVPNLNMGHFIGSTLESIATQSRPVDEVIVVDNQSEDNSLEVIDSFKGRFTRLEVLTYHKRNPASVRNAGITASRSDSIAFLDADDLWHPRKVEKQVKRLESNPPIEVVGSRICFFDEQHPNLPEPSQSAQTKISSAPSLGSLIVRRSLFDQIGLLNDDFLYGEDWDFYFRIRDHGIAFAIQKYVTAFVRRHGKSMMATTNPQREKDLTRVFMQSILRRRKLGLDGQGSKDFTEFEELAGS